MTISWYCDYIQFQEAKEKTNKRRGIKCQNAGWDKAHATISYLIERLLHDGYVTATNQDAHHSIEFAEVSIWRA